MWWIYEFCEASALQRELHFMNQMSPLIMILGNTERYVAAVAYVTRAGLIESRST